MNIIFIIVYSLLLILVIKSLLKKNIKEFLILFGLLFSFSSLMQYVIFPEYKTTEGYRDISLDRIFFEYVNTFILLIASTVFKTVSSKTSVLKNFRILIFIWIFFNFLSVLNSIDFARSFNAFIIAVINPILFVRLFNNKKIIHNPLNFLILFFCVLISFNLGIKYLSIFFNIARGTITNFSIGYGAVEFGILRGNSATNFLSFFLPLLFFNPKYLNDKSLARFLRIIKYFLVFVFLTAGSRTGYILFGLLFLYGILKNKLNLKQGIGLIILFLLCISFYSYFNEDSFSTFLIDRFTSKGDTAIESASNDERLVLWAIALNFFIENGFEGVGMSNYFLVFEKYGNAHNLYVTLLFESGIVVFMLLIVMIIFSIIIQRRNIKLTLYEPNKLFFSFLLVGLYFYLIASFTGESFVSISQTVHSFPSYIFTIFIFFPIYYFNALYVNKK
jgi:O-antigen ligase